MATYLNKADVFVRFITHATIRAAMIGKELKDLLNYIEFGSYLMQKNIIGITYKFGVAVIVYKNW